MVLHDSANSARDKKLCDIIRVVLAESNEPKLTAESLSVKIQENYSLSFSPIEIKNAISRKGSGYIISSDNNQFYSITDLEKKDTLEKTNLAIVLDQFIQQFFNVHPDLPSSIKDLEEVVIRYLYYCFKWNATNIQYLLQGKLTTEVSDFDATNEQIALIDSFLKWENEGKNQFLYKVISSCFEYCMLTTNKNDSWSKKIFNGKKFYLDANIVFRLAGFNNDDRQYVTKMFVKKCKEANIQLLYTSETYSEVRRVIDAKVAEIISLCDRREPVSYETIQKLGYSYKTNDFYAMYYRWTLVPGNRYDDYEGYRKYLYDQVSNIENDLVYDPINIAMNTERLEELKEKLRIYKENRHKESPSKSGVESDIRNLLYILHNRRITSATSIWQTNVFFVSADQLLTNWAMDEFKGAPLVVTPSVWLTILLKITGRTDDDYDAFCTFLRLPQSGDGKPTFDPEQVMRSLNAKTDDKTVKEKIIDEIVLNASYYRVFAQNGEYDEMTEKAFDVILANSAQPPVNHTSVSTVNVDSTDMNPIKADEVVDPKAEEARILSDLAEKEVSRRIKQYLNRITKAGNAMKLIIEIICIIVTIIWIVAIIPRTCLGKLVSSQACINYDFASLTVPIIATVLGPAIIGLYKGIISLLKAEKTLYKKEQKLRKKVERMYHIGESNQSHRQ